MKLVDDAVRGAQGLSALAFARLSRMRRRKVDEDVLAIVFSRDRALQLELLLETYAACVTQAPRLTVMYSVTSDVHGAAYADVLERYRHLIAAARQETHFRTDLIATLRKSGAEKVIFLVDDLIFIRPIDGALLRGWDIDKGILSLRLGGNIRSSYNAGRDALPLPSSLRTLRHAGAELITWIWETGEHDWQLALALDGHLLPKALVERLIGFSRFRAPNSLEGALGRFRFLFKNKRAFAFATSRIVNLPLNTVKSEDYYFPHAGMSVEAMLADHRHGMKFDASGFPLEQQGSCHFPWVPPLVARDPAHAAGRPSART